MDQNQQNEEQGQENKEQESAENISDVSQENVNTVTQEVSAHDSKNVVIVAVLGIIVVVLALMYIWGSSLDVAPERAPAAGIVPAPEVPVDVPPMASDEVEDITTDLVMPEIENLDEEIAALEADLDAVLTE